MNDRLVRSLALLLALVAAAASVWVSLRIFEAIPHVEDEYANLWQAEVMAQGQLYLPSPPEPRSFLVAFVVDHEGRRFGKYPPGWPAALSLGARLNATWLVNPLLAGLAVWLIFRLGESLVGARTALLAALLAASSPMLYMLSGSMMSHLLSLVLALALARSWFDLFPLSVRASSPARTIPIWMPIAVSALALGLLALTRPLSAVGVAVPFALHGLWMLVKGSAEQRTRILALGAGGLAVAGLLPVWQWALTGSAWLNPYTLWWPYDRVGFGPGLGHTESGHNLLLALANTMFSLKAGLHDLFGWPYLSWLLLPVGLWALRRNRAVLLLAASLPSLIMAYAFYWVGSWLLGPRYYFEALPGLCLLSAAGLAFLLKRPPSAGTFRRWVAHLTTGLFALLLAGNLVFYLPARIGGMRGLYNTSRQARQYLEDAELGNALVFVHLQSSWKDYGTLLTLVPPYRDSDFLLAISRRPGANLAVVQAYPDRPVLHYYPGNPPELLDQPR